MQKKSLLVALFCGALCLVGCIKNEESASVAQVRIAKANELNSIADLNKAKAQAEVIYANAEATIKSAEAELKKAEAALVLAQAETEKVRAELLKVKVELETVRVEEERVKLQMKQAELEVALANAEAAKAAAAAAEQYWINKLQDLLAEAEINAAENAAKLIKAENKILKLEGQRADSAKVYAQLYFEALDTVAVYQTRLIEYKVMRVLANRAAPEIRDEIHKVIDGNNEQIAENNAKIEAYKKYQELTPEEAEAQYQAASDAAGVAYTAWMEKKQAKSDAIKAQGELENKTADFLAGWETTKFSKVEAEVRGLGTKTIKGVKHHGIYGEDDEFTTLWSDEKVKSTPVRYPNKDVYAPGEITSYDDVTIVPAAIEYDNIKAALDTAVAHREAFANMGIAFAEFFTGLQIASLEDKAAGLTEEIAAHQKYVDAMKDSVDKYEKAYLDTLAKSKKVVEDAENAWEAFQEYMLYTYPTVSRDLFAERVKKQKDYDAKKKLSDDAETAYNTMVGNIPTYIEDVADAHDDYETAIGNYNKAAYTISQDPEHDVQAYQTALMHWNPNFNVDGKTNKDDYQNWPSIYETASWGESLTAAMEGLANKGTEGVIAGTEAKDVQIRLFIAKKRVKAAEQELYLLEQGLVRNPKGSQLYESLKTKYDNFVKETGDKGQYVLAYEELDAAELAAYGKEGSTQQIGAKGTYEKTWEAVEELYAAVDTTIYNKISDTEFHKIVKYPTTGHPNDDYFVDDDYCVDGVWKIKIGDFTYVLGSAQVDLIEAVMAVVDAKAKTSKTEPVGELYEAMTTAKADTDDAAAALKTANENLYKEILRVDALTPGEAADAAKFKDEKADKLYKDYKAAEAKKTGVDANVTKAWNTLLKKGYSFNPDQIGTLDEHPIDNYYKGETKYNHQFGWLRSSYHVDYEATCLNNDGERVSIARFLYPFSWTPYEYSLQYQLEEAEEDIEENLPEMLETIKTFWANDIKAYKSTVAGIVATVNGYKANEAGYKTWVAEREAAAKTVAEATKAEFDAKQERNEANAEYEAARAALNGGVIYEVWDDSRDGRYSFKKVEINEAIDKLEKENEDLEKQNEMWYQTLSDGKVALGLVNQILDEVIEKTEEAIEIWNAIANNYKAIMNAYLGIVEEAAVETPVVEEGDEE